MKAASESVCERENCTNKVFYMENPSDAGDIMKKNIENNDLILVKGSQSMRMEKVVEKIMKNPKDAHKFLCRQSKNGKIKSLKLYKYLNM